MKSYLIFFAVLINFTFASAQEEHSSDARYILIEAPCKPGFNAVQGSGQKVILTKIFKAEFDTPFAMVNAEPNLITEFESALEAAYPDSRNQIKDILVFMLRSEKEAEEVLNQKLTLYKSTQTAVIELKLR